MAFWIFQGNPRTSYRLSDALTKVHLHDMKMTWDVRQHQSRVNTDDTVCGSLGALVASSR